MPTTNTLPTLIVIGGPTASGKTSTSIQLAQHLGTEIISADSRQFYKEMNIGTAKPTPSELAAAKHHFVGHISIADTYTVGDYERDTIELLQTLFTQHSKVIMCGGSGMFIRAVCEGLDVFPSVPEGIREELQAIYQAEGMIALQTELQLADPVYYAQVDIHNPQRVMRALELYRATGQAYSQFLTGSKALRPFQVAYYCINWEREALYARINQRVLQMMTDGLLAEAEALYPLRHLNALQTVGYQELFDYMDGLTSLDEAISLIQQHSRNYAKRQMTWFRKNNQYRFIGMGDWEEMV